MMIHKLTLVTLGLCLGVFACGGDDDSTDTTAGDDAESTSPGGDTPGTDTSMVTVAEAAAGACDEDTTMGSEDCDTGPYLECAQTECAAEYEECLGAGYKSGNFSGAVCQTFLECSVNSGDVCENDCEQDEACDDCFAEKVGNCVFSKCFDKLSSCFEVDIPGLGGGGAGGTEAGCAELSACCATLSGDDKTSCDELVASAGGIDLICGVGLLPFQISGQCN